MFRYGYLVNAIGGKWIEMQQKGVLWGWNTIKEYRYNSQGLRRVREDVQDLRTSGNTVINMNL